MPASCLFLLKSRVHELTSRNLAGAGKFSAQQDCASAVLLQALESLCFIDCHLSAKTIEIVALTSVSVRILTPLNLGTKICRKGITSAMG